MTTAASGSRMQRDADLTARARIRDAAIRRFADEGVAGTTLKAIAEDAGVSPALVMHHFGSKEGLRTACDEHVAALISEQKRAAMTGGVDPLSSLRQVEEGAPLLRYLARTLVDGSAHVDTLIDELVDDAVGYMEEGVAHGYLNPTERPRERSAVLVIWNLGALVLHEQVRRLFGADLLAPDARQFLQWALPVGDVLTNGVFTEELHDRMRGAAETLAAEDQHEQEGPAR